MLLVPITPYGDIQWDKIFEVESLESWSEGLNERIEKMEATTDIGLYLQSESNIRKEMAN